MRSMPVAVSLLMATATVAAARQAQQARPIEQAAKAAAAVKVTRAVVAVGVVDRHPVGAAESFPAEIGTLYFFNVFEGEFAELEVEHVWLREGEELARVPLQARGPHWRTWSFKQIPPGLGGRWAVQVVAGDGQVLHTVEFMVDG